MGDIEIAVTRCKRLETLLEAEFGATGRGLHEKVSSVQDELPDALVRKLRFIATVRNKLVHEADVKGFDNRQDYEAACNIAERELKRLGRRGAVLPALSLNSTPVVVTLIVLLLFLVVVAIVFVSGVSIPIH